MQRVQRQFGKALKRSPDETDVGVIIEEFNATGKALKEFIEATKAWRDAWSEILFKELSVSEDFAHLYKPIKGDGEEAGAGADHSQTPKRYMDKCLQLNSCYGTLKSDLTEDLNSIDAKLIRPAMDSKDSMSMLKKTIKNRENCKLDYERHKSRVDHAGKKEVRSMKDEAALARHEQDMANAKDEYNAADEQIRRGLPPVMAAVQKLFPYLLATQVMIQHGLVAQLYTTLHEYCQQHHLPSPAPPMEQIIGTWESEFSPIKAEVESSIRLIANGKAVHQPMTIAEKGNTITGLGIRTRIGNVRQNSLGSFTKPGASPKQEMATHDEEEEAPPMKPPRPSFGSQSLAEKPRISSGRAYNGASNPGTPFMPSPGVLSPTTNSPTRFNNDSGSSFSTPYATPVGSSYSGTSPAPHDYFAHQRKPSASSVASSIKKKPPPPPPKPKRFPSQQGEYVTALYDFDGQNEGDLAFREGDQIRVLKKTGSTDDWWEGEVRGSTGSFPANYVRV